MDSTMVLVEKNNIEALLNNLDNILETSRNNDNLITADNILSETMELVDYVSNVLDNILVEISNEGLITRVVVSVLDGIIGYISKIRAAWQTAFKDLPDYSELELYIKKHRIATSKVESLSYSKIVRIMMLNPPTHEKPLESIKTIRELYKNFQINIVNSSVLSVINECVASIRGEFYKDVENTIKRIKYPFDIGSQAKTYVSKNMNVIVGKTPFGRMFNSISEFIKHSNECLEIKDLINHCNKSLDIMSKISNKIEKLQSDVHNEKITINNEKGYIQSCKVLGKFIENLAKYYEGYGFLAKIYTHHEHHICEIYEVLRKYI